MRRLRTILTLGLLAAAFLLAGCVRDQQAPRTRVPGVDKPPEKQESGGTQPANE